jgi:thiol-disulfide isomerase/thioredoxin
MNENPRFLKLLVLLVGMTLLATAFGTLSWNDGGTEPEISPLDEVIEGVNSNEIPISHGTRSPAMTTRSVLVELFTGTWCTWCQGAEGALNRLANEYPQTQLSILEYHVGDVYEAPGNPARRAYYLNPAYPTAIFDGIDVKTGGSLDPDDPAMYSDYKMRIDNRLPIPSPFAITLNGSLGATTGSITAKITAIDPVPPGLLDLKARFVVYEDHNYTVFEGGREYRLRYSVVANLLEEPITPDKEDVLRFTKSFTLDPAWELDKIGACVFVQADNSNEVVQATSINLSASSSKVDLALTPLDISFSDPTPYETQTITIYATVHNVGTSITPSNVYVRFYNGDPDMGGSQIGAEQDAGIIGAGG